jgi:crotonobetaine/carnitine-CoA ligase
MNRDFDPYDLALEQRLIGPLLARRARSEGERTFLSVGGRDWSFAQTDRACRALARGMAARGMAAQECVALLLPNGAEIILSWFACALLRLVNVPLNPALGGTLLETPLRDSAARGIVVSRQTLPALASLRAEVRAQFDWVAVVGGIDGAELPAGPREYLDFADLMIGEGDDPEREADFRDRQTIFYTSGTTGPAKGVQTVNAHQFSAACGFLRAVGLTRDDVLYTPFPLFHGLAARLGVLPCLLVGARAVIGERFSATRFWEEVTACGATVAHSIFSTPGILLERPPGPYDRAHTVRAMFNSHSNPAFEARFNTRLVEAFSMTETGFVLYARWPEHREGSAGRVHEDWEARLVDELDRPVPDGEAGELVLRPKLPFIMMQGYLEQPAATVAAFRNLWFHTGDILRRDADGWHFYVDRSKERIRRRGENLSSHEIEEMTGTHPELVECAALPHPAGPHDDDIRLVAVRRTTSAPTEPELIAWLEQRLPKAMVPRYVEFVDMLPRTATSKIEKVKLIRAGLGPTAWDRTRQGDAG